MESVFEEVTTNAKLSYGAHGTNEEEAQHNSVAAVGSTMVRWDWWLGGTGLQILQGSKVWVPSPLAPGRPPREMSGVS